MLALTTGFISYIQIQKLLGERKTIATKLYSLTNTYTYFTMLFSTEDRRESV